MTPSPAFLPEAGNMWPATTLAPVAPPISGREWGSTAPSPVSTPTAGRMWSPTASQPALPPTAERGQAPTTPDPMPVYPPTYEWSSITSGSTPSAPISPPGYGNPDWSPSPSTPASSPMEMYGNRDDDDQPGNNNSGGVSSSSSSSSSSTSSATFPCTSEVAACVVDSQPGGCWDCLQEVSSNGELTCDTNAATCSDLVRMNG